PRRCHTGSATTTNADRTARLAAGHRSAVSTTSRGRTSRSCLASRSQVAGSSNASASSPRGPSITEESPNKRSRPEGSAGGRSVVEAAAGLLLGLLLLALFLQRLLRRLLC